MCILEIYIFYGAIKTGYPSFVSPVSGALKRRYTYSRVHVAAHEYRCFKRRRGRQNYLTRSNLQNVYIVLVKFFSHYYYQNNS